MDIFAILNFRFALFQYYQQKYLAEKLKIKSLVYSLSAVILWSTVATAFKLTLRGMDYLQLLFYSSLTSSLALLVIALITSRQEFLSSLKGDFSWNTLLLGLLNPFLYYLVLFKAYSLLPAQEAQPLNYTWPIVLSIMSGIFLKQPLSVRTIFGLLIAFGGVFIIASRGHFDMISFHNTAGVLLAVGSSVIWASYWILNLLDKRTAQIKLFSAFLFGTVCSGIYLAFTGSLILNQPVYLWGAVYVGLFEMGITFFFWMRGLSLSNNSARTATLAYLSPFISLIFIAAVLDETIALSSVAGLVLIIAGIILQQSERQNKKNLS